MSDVDETINRLKTHKNVIGVVVVNSEGSTIRTTLDPKQTSQYSTLISQLAVRAQVICRELDPEDECTFIRIRTKKHEIMAAPEKEYILIVLQDPSTSDHK